MKAELAHNGPISCGIQATDNFDNNYNNTFEIYKEHIPGGAIINHEIAVVGYGVDSDSGEEFWIGRNSWGSYWGDYGFFRMTMYGDNLGIDLDCTAGTPTFTPNTPEVFVQ